MEMKALKDQLEVERQMWEASCAKKEVGSRKPRCFFLPRTPDIRAGGMGFRASVASPRAGFPVSRCHSRAAQGSVALC